MASWFENRTKCYCAFCKSERIVYKQRSVGVGAAIGALAGSLTVMLLIFHTFDPRFILYFIVFLLVAEIFIRIRWRISVVCKYCGFDPVLYLKDTQRAVERVKNKLSQRQQSPEFFLAKPLDLPRISRGKSEFIEKAQQISVARAEEDRKKQTGKLLNRSL
jgi:hypothetical protein